jgi:hypothetical protein
MASKDPGAITREQALRAYATMMNTMDPSHLVPLLADDFHYALQRVFSDIVTKEEFVAHITMKLRSINESGELVYA